jgi:hypothetical protein
MSKWLGLLSNQPVQPGKKQQTAAAEAVVAPSPSERRETVATQTPRPCTTTVRPESARGRDPSRTHGSGPLSVPCVWAFAPKSWSCFCRVGSGLGRTLKLRNAGLGLGTFRVAWWSRGRLHPEDSTEYLPVRARSACGSTAPAHSQTQ